MRKITSMLTPTLWLRDREAVNRIKRARTAEEALDLVHLAKGLGEPAWEDRMRRFGPEVLPLIAQHLKAVMDIRDEDIQDMVMEHLIAELRWRGSAGADVLLDCFDHLNNYGKSLACVTLGLLGAQAAADRIWSFYQQSQSMRDGEYWIGALWGLIDLKDERAGEALADLLVEGRDFYERFGFVALAGDARAVIPLLKMLVRTPADDSDDVKIALLGVVHRIGREAFVAELEKAVPPGRSREEIESLVDRWLAQPVSLVKEHFTLFYHGLGSDEVERVLQEMSGR
jgi:hypothetical protein